MDNTLNKYVVSAFLSAFFVLTHGEVKKAESKEQLNKPLFDYLRAPTVAEKFPKPRLTFDIPHNRVLATWENDPAWKGQHPDLKSEALRHGILKDEERSLQNWAKGELCGGAVLTVGGLAGIAVAALVLEADKGGRDLLALSALATAVGAFIDMAYYTHNNQSQILDKSLEGLPGYTLIQVSQEYQPLDKQQENTK